jgi:hypothetical protein
MPLRASSFVLATIIILEPAAALANFRSVNRQQVNVVDATSFEVVGRAGALVDDYWCAAGDFARRSLRIPWQTTLYLARGRGPGVTSNRRTTVLFTTDPNQVQAASGSSVVSSGMRVGTARTVTDAFGRCDDLSLSRSDR